jgi:catechol 2,3-dioxygenase-like lactoylglutathione lyase family enzyme
VTSRPPFIDHLALLVSDYERSKAFYEGALEPWGSSTFEIEGPACGIGPKGSEDFWIAPGGPTVPRLHIAFLAPSRAVVHAFHESALAAGGRDNGGPGPRPQYHEHYYAAYVLDPDGHNVEAVCHDPVEPD